MYRDPHPSIRRSVYLDGVTPNLWIRHNLLSLSSVSHLAVVHIKFLSHSCHCLYGQVWGLWAAVHVRLIVPLRTRKDWGYFCFLNVMCLYLYLTLPGCQGKVSLQGKPLTLLSIQVYHLWLWQISMACLSCSYMKVVVIGYLKIFIDDWAYTFRDKLPLYLGWGVSGALPRTINKFWSTFQSPTCLSRPAPCLWLCDEDQTLAWNVTASLYKYAKTSF